MFKKVYYFLIGASLIANSVVGQCPVSNFTLPATGCIEENIFPSNISTGASSYFWDFCSGDFELTPSIETIGTSTFLNRGRSFRVVKTNENGWIGFSIDQTSNFLVRFEFGSQLANTPIITNLGNPSNVLARAWDFIIYQESNEWYILVINSTTNELIRYSFGADLLNLSPTAENLGNFGELSTPNNLTIANDSGNVFLFISNGGNGTISRIEFGNSILNTPTASSFSVAGINNPRGIDIVKDCDTWVGLVTSYSNNKVFYLDFQNGISTPPVSGEISFFTSYSFPAALSIEYEGGDYYSLIQSALGDLYKLSFGSSISDFTGTGENFGDFGLYSNFATEWVGDKSEWFGFSIEVSNPSTPGAGNLIRYTFPTTCNAAPSTSTAENPKVHYSLDGLNQISLETHDISNNVNSVTKTITISPTLAPQLTSQITGNCLSAPINFLGQQVSGDITNWNWDFGDGSGTSTLQDANYTYASTGSYQVKLSVTDANGCNNLLIDTVQVYEESVPDFIFSEGTSLCKNNLVTFTNTSTGETGEIVNWNWDFNGEGSSNLKNPEFIFTTAGVKNITLTSSISGCANVVQKTLTIVDAPTTNFEFVSTCNGVATGFADLTIGDNLTSWSWDFGDGTFSTEQNTSHTYAAPGSYDVTLIVTNNTGCFTSATQTVVNYSNPVAKFKNDLPCSTTPIQFTDQSLVDNANIIAWEWDFGDGATSSEQHPDHLYGQTGNFTVKLKSYSQFGCADSTESLITVVQGPEVAFEWDKSCEGEATTFTDLTNSFSSPITNWTWVINGVLHTNQNPTYTFTNSGTYTVQLSVTMDNLCTQTITEDIIIEEPPIVQFDYSEDCSTSNTSFYDLTDQTNDAIISREWRVNGAIISSDSVATAALEPGNYEITLSVVTNSGCEEITTSTVSLVGSPTADFNSNTVYGATPLVVNFNNLSSGGTNYEWSFGDANNSTSTEQNPSFIYTEIGIYDVTLRSSSAVDCYNESILQLEVVAPITEASLLAITPIADNEKTNYILTIENSGTTLITNSTNIIFRTDYGAEIVEPINTVIYAGKTINYSPSFAITSSSSTQNLCIELISPEAIQLDEECIALNSSIVISEPYPNPTIGQADIDIILERALTVHIRLINRTGQPVYSATYEGVSGLNKFSIDGIGLPQDIYVVEVSVNGKSEQFKLSVVR